MVLPSKRIWRDTLSPLSCISSEEIAAVPASRTQSSDHSSSARQPWTHQGQARRFSTPDTSEASYSLDNILGGEQKEKSIYRKGYIVRTPYWHTAKASRETTGYRGFSGKLCSHRPRLRGSASKRVRDLLEMGYRLIPYQQ
jgi:hypothetical protein